MRWQLKVIKNRNIHHSENIKDCPIDLSGITATVAELNILDGVTATASEVNILDGVTASASELNILDGVTATAAQLNYLAGVTAGLPAASKALVLNSSSRLAPTRSAAAYAYGIEINSDLLFTGGAAQKSYMVGIFGDRPVGSAATGDSNDALIRSSGNNYAANDTNFVFRGLNVSINNRSGGVLGRIDNNVSTQGKSGGTVNNILGLMVTAENYGTVSDLFGGLDVLLKNEAAIATTEFGIRIRNENNSIASAIGAAVLVSDTGANIGWTYGLDLNGATVQTADLRLHNGTLVQNTDANTVTITEQKVVLAGVDTADTPVLKLTGAGSFSPVAYATAGSAWGDGATPGFAADQMFLLVDYNGTVYRLPVWANA